MSETSSELTFAVEVSPGAKLSLPPEVVDRVGAGFWEITIRLLDDSAAPGQSRGHTAFLNGYAPEDEGLYDDYPTR